MAMKEIFDNYIETSFDGREQAQSKILQFELNYLSHFPTKPAKTLDIGIGRGEMLSCMKNWGMDYQGIDISPSTVRLCQAMGLKCDVTDDSVDWLKKHEGHFQTITCLDVLEHVPREHTIEFAKAIKNALTEDGKAIIQVPNLQSPYGYLHHFNDFTHVSGFVEHSLAQVLLAAGFSKMTFFGFEEIYQKNARFTIKKILRYFYRKSVYFLRSINSNPNPKILDPVMYVIAQR